MASNDLWGQIQQNNGLAKNKAGLAANAAQASQGYKGYGITPGQGGYMAPPHIAISSPGEPSSRWARLAQVGAQKVQSLLHSLPSELVSAGRAVARPVKDIVTGKGGKTAHDVAQLSADVSGGTTNQFVRAARYVPQAISREVRNKPITDIQQKAFGTTNQGNIAKKIAASTVGTGSLLVGGGGAKGIVSGVKAGTTKLAEQTMKSAAKNATIGAVGNASATINQNPNASKKDVLGSAKSGAILGGTLGAAGTLVAKGGNFAIQKGKMIINREANKTETVASNIKQPTKINVSDQSSIAKGTVSKTLPTVKDPIVAIRPSDKGYSNIDFRLQFNKGAKEVVSKSPDKFTYLDEKFNKTQDPITQVIGTLSHTSNKSTIKGAIDHLLPDIDSTAKNRLVKDIGTARNHQEVADHLWDAAKNYETRVAKPGIPLVKKISFNESDTKVSDMGGERPNSELQSAIEKAHNAGDKVQTEKLIQQLPDASTRDAMRNSVNIPTIETKLVVNPETMKTERVPIAQTGKNILPTKSNGVLTSSRLSQSINAKAVENKLTEDLDQPQYHHTLDIKEQAQKASDLINKDEQRSIDIALGKRNAPSGLHPHAVFVAVEKKAMQDGDINLIRQLATSKRVDEATAAGQTLRVLRERNETSPVAAIQHVIDARSRIVEKRLGQSSASMVAKTSREIESNIKKSTKEDWHSFIESIKC